ncbi:hypothetical protein KBI23_06930 [bacterium]|nr:hypothetical protein [bacterium]MBP9810932.1 hypothetical protein [bacterium]
MAFPKLVLKRAEALVSNLITWLKVQSQEKLTERQGTERQRVVSDQKPAKQENSKSDQPSFLSKTINQQIVFVCASAAICLGGMQLSLLSPLVSFLALMLLGLYLQEQSNGTKRRLTKALLELKSGREKAYCAGDKTSNESVNSEDVDLALAEAFKSLATSLKDLDSGHRQWVADTSHELRTPIAVLRAQVEAFQDGVHEITPRNLEVLHSEVMALSKLVDDLHWLAKYDVGQIRSQASALDINQTLQDVLESFEERREAKEIALDNRVPTEEKLIIDGDSSRIRQVITNLVENSLRYTNKGGTLRINHSRSGKTLKLFFEDTEPGVPDELLPKLFDRFFRVESSRSRTMGGSGLGLAICLNNMQMLGGTIEASHSAMGGLKIELTLPARPETNAKGSKTNLQAIDGEIADKIDGKEEGV